VDAHVDQGWPGAELGNGRHFGLKRATESGAAVMSDSGQTLR